jgi:hypothetical protein
MSYDCPLTQSRSFAALAVAVILLVALLAAGGVGVVAGQAQNGTNGTTGGNATPASGAGSSPNTSALTQNGSSGGNGTGAAPANQSNGSGSANRTTSPQNGTGPTNGSRGSGTGGGGSAGGGAPRGNMTGLLDGNTTWGEYARNNRVGQTNSSGNASGNATGNQSGGNASSGGGVLGAIGGAVGGAVDFTTGVLDHFSGSSDEWFGKTVSGFFNGARAFFGWMFGFFIEQGMGIINDTIDKAVKAFTMTPHPNKVNNFYQNPSNAPWGWVYDMFQQTGLPLARLLWLLSLAYVMVGGNQFGAGTMSYAKEKQTWVGLAISAFFISDAGWTLTNLVPHVVDVFTQAFTHGITTTPVMNSMAKGMVVLFVLLLIYFELSAVIGLMIVAAFRILVIIGFAPFIPALVVAMYSPFGLLSWIAKAGIHLWLVLLVAAMPSALLLNASFAMAQSAANGSFDLLGTVMVIPLIVGGLLASAFMPFLLWKASSSIGSAIGISMPGSENGQQVREKMSEYRQKAARPNRFQRGFRRKESAQDNGESGAHRAGKATRNAPRNTKQKASSAATTARNASSTAKRRAANMMNKISKLASRGN